MTAEVVLPARLDSAAAPEVAAALKAHAGEDLRLDGRAVVHVGALSLQALLAGARTARAAGTEFAIDGLPEAAIEQLMLYGLTPDSLSEGLPE